MSRRHPLPELELDALEQRLGGAPRQRLSPILRRLGWRISRRAGAVAKRGLDIGLAAGGLVTLSPLLLTVACLIKLTDHGPVLFWQERIGKWGRGFRFPKFRSMVVDAEAQMARLQALNVHGQTGVTFKMKSDPRITWIGRIIRKTSIDELPQLWCVLKGDMSLVGPRPALAREVARYSLEDRQRLEATPGLTCTWQVSGRSDIPFPEQLRLDTEYIEQQSLWTDLKLLARTIPAVITGKGAY